MLQITINVNAPSGNAQMIKESLAMFLERWGDCRVAQVKEVAPQSFQRQEHQQQRFY